MICRSFMVPYGSPSQLQLRHRPVLHLLGLLRLRLSTVDAAGGLGWVSTAEGGFVHQNDLSTALQHSVGGRNAGQTATNHDRLHGEKCAKNNCDRNKRSHNISIRACKMANRMQCLCLLLFSTLQLCVQWLLVALHLHPTQDQCGPFFHFGHLPFGPAQGPLVIGPGARSHKYSQVGIPEPGCLTLFDFYRSPVWDLCQDKLCHRNRSPSGRLFLGQVLQISHHLRLEIQKATKCEIMWNPLRGNRPFFIWEVL